MADQAIGGVQDRMGRTVVVLEADDFRVGKEALKFENVCRFRTAPPVDRLVVVADHADMEGCANELLEQTHLERVGVLELIDRHAREALAKNFPDIIVFA